MRLNMETDPPPDIAIDADVTSKTTLAAYAVLQVPEVWIYDTGKLTIYLLQDDGYQPGASSLVFPDLAIADWIPQLVQQAFTAGTSAMLRELRRRLQSEKPEVVMISD